MREVAELHRRYGPLVLRRCRSLLQDRAAAEDVAQEVFLRVMGNLDAFQGQCSPVSWIYRIATNLCIDQLRRQARQQTVALGDELAEALGSAAPDAEQLIIGRTELQQLLGGVDGQSLQILVHTYLDGMGQEEVAELLGLSRKTVWTKLDRLRRRLATRKT